jgi:hypothetical protein
MSSRKEFHFIFGLRERTQPLHLLHYLSLVSCFEVNRPQAIHLHFRHEPSGPWWERIRPALCLHRIDAPVNGYSPQRYFEHAEGRLVQRLELEYAHEADFLRLDLLLEHGGVYADIDTLFVRPYPARWYTAEFAIGEESSPYRPGEPLRASLCNALMFAQPGARFARAWRDRMPEAFDGSWSRHSCQLAARIWQLAPATVNVLPSAYFYRYGATVAGLRTLLEESDRERDDLYSVHLWAHLWWSRARTDFSSVHADEIDERWLRERDCTLARLARPFLDARF